MSAHPLQVRVENSFIPVRGIGERTERDLWASGITEWDAFDPSLLGPTKSERVQEYIETARTHLSSNDATFFAETFPQQCHWRLYESFRDDACFLDIETTGLSQRHHDVTVVSTHRGGETTTLVKDETLSVDSLRQAMEGASLLVTFNGKRFDVPFLEQAFGISIDVPHLDLMYPCRKAGLTGGLKQIESMLDIGRDGADISGRDAVRLWREHERGNRRALDMLIEYNRDDTVNLESVADTVVDRLHQQVFEATLATNQTQLD